MSNKLVTAYDMIKARDAAIDELQNEVNRLAPYEMFYERTLKRAEAAERRVAELEVRLEIVGGRADDMAEWWKVANDDAEWLRVRIAELEAQLAAQAWRPVTEKPTEAGYYQAVNDGLYEHCYYGPNGWEDYYLTPTHWRPLTDPPLTGES